MVTTPSPVTVGNECSESRKVRYDMIQCGGAEIDIRNGLHGKEFDHPKK